MRTATAQAIAAMMLLQGAAGCSKHESVSPPQLRINPEPVERYRARLLIPDPPGPLSVTAQVTYWISNRRACVPVDRTLALGGSRPSFQETIDIPVTANADGEYEIVYFDDLFSSEDYYGMGACTWEGSPTLVIKRGGSELVASTRSRDEMLNVVDERLCPSRSGSYSGTCVVPERARQDLQEYFNIELLTTRN